MYTVRHGTRAVRREGEAYCRDRRKDQLLQKHGYLVLRFLAEDMGKCLDVVLDAILRALAHERQTRDPWGGSLPEGFFIGDEGG